MATPAETLTIEAALQQICEGEWCHHEWEWSLEQPLERGPSWQLRDFDCYLLTRTEGWYSQTAEVQAETDLVALARAMDVAAVHLNAELRAAHERSR